jgi:HPt (histidine-containing phosphotransfer) domain-containing protein
MNAIRQGRGDSKMYSTEPQPALNENLHQAPVIAKTSLKAVCDFDGALARLGGDRRLLIELVHIYIEDAPMLLVRITNGVREANCSDVLHAAHLLRGLAANFGAPSVTEPAQRLEEFAMAGKLEDAPATIAQLQTEAGRLKTALQPYC